MKARLPNTAVGLCVAGLLAVPALANGNPIVLTAVSADTSAGVNTSEYVELSNISTTPVDLDGWHILFFSSACAPTATFALGTGAGGETEVLVPAGGDTVVPPGGWVLITSNEASGTFNADYAFTTDNVVTGNAAVRVLNGAAATIDTLGWGTAGASCREGSAALNLGADDSLVRDGRASCPIDTNSNDADYSLVSPDVAPFNSSSPPNTCSKLLTVQVLGSGTGTVTGPGIGCPGDCTELYATGSMVTLTASPTGGSSFGGWGVDCAGVTPDCTLTLSSARTASATFNPPTPPPTGTSLPVATPGATGKRAAALRKCRKKKGKARRNCKRKANNLPI
jgi:hypothetical protein